MRRWAVGVGVLTAVFIVVAMARLSLNADVFDLLPTGSRMVEGLRLYQGHFGATRDLIVSVHSSSSELTDKAVESLAADLASSGLTSQVFWRDPFHDPEDLGELVAYLWFNQPPADFAHMAERFRDGNRERVLEETLDRMTTSMRPDVVARLARDPYRLLDVVDRISSQFSSGLEGNPFASADGRFRILMVEPPVQDTSFWVQRRWVRQVTAFTTRWHRGFASDDPITIGITGNPAFVSELGTGLLNDIVQSAIGTLLLVAGLFWLAHRRWVPLLWLVALLILIMSATVVIGEAVLGTIQTVSLGFAAILAGLAADYGLILYQELVVHPHRGVSDHRREVAPSILWSAITTAVAFFLIGRSSLPGLTQLGVLVGAGILIAAATMLVAYLPPLLSVRPSPADAPPPAASTPTGPASRQPWPGHPVAWLLTLVAVAAAAGVLSWKRPHLDVSTQELGPKGGRARAAMAVLEKEIGGYGDAMWLVVPGRDDHDVGTRLADARKTLHNAVDTGLLAGFDLPDALWPHPARQRENRDTALWLSGRLQAARAAALAAGFSPKALTITEGALRDWGRFAADEGVAWPRRPGVRWLFDQFAAREPGRVLALGRVRAADDASRTQLFALADNLASSSDAYLFSWPLLSTSLLKIVRADVGRVLIPMGVALLVLLALTFRRPGEIMLSVFTLLLSLAVLMAVMAVTGMSWNLMNVIVLPLLFGAGVDYSIHTQLALKRTGADTVLVRRSVGRAILLCGASTACAFGTLAFASNAGLASLGRVCVTGVVIVTLISVFLLPVWWHALHAGRYRTSPRSTP